MDAATRSRAEAAQTRVPGLHLTARLLVPAAFLNATLRDRKRAAHG